jgi:hypothetical protein
MRTESFSFLLDLAGRQVKKNDTNFRTAVSAEERLFITLTRKVYLLININILQISKQIP